MHLRKSAMAAVMALALCSALGASAGDPSRTKASAQALLAERPPNLVFWSGFEGPLKLLKPTDCYRKGCFQQLIGTDSATGFSWPFRILGGDNKFQLLVDGPRPTPETVGQYMVNELRTVIGHKGKPTQALYSEVRQSGCCGIHSQGGRATQNVFHIFPGAEPGEMYISKWVMLQPDLLDKLHSGDGWRSIFEWKEGVRDNGQFRIQLQVIAYNGGPLTWMTKWDNLAGPVPRMEEYHRKYNRTVPVPVGKWFKLEIFWHRSTGRDGRAWFAVNGQVIDDHYGPNIGPNGTQVGRIMVSQLYSGSTYPIYQWMDDVQIWKGFPTASPGDPWYDPPYAPH